MNDLLSRVKLITAGHHNKMVNKSNLEHFWLLNTSQSPVVGLITNRMIWKSKE